MDAEPGRDRRGDRRGDPWGSPEPEPAPPPRDSGAGRGLPSAGGPGGPGGRLHDVLVALGVAKLVSALALVGLLVVYYIAQGRWLTAAFLTLVLAGMVTPWTRVHRAYLQWRQGRRRGEDA